MMKSSCLVLFSHVWFSHVVDRHIVTCLTIDCSTTRGIINLKETWLVLSWRVES
jgi:hypothetical protein